jgi:hypothetical protein
VKPTANSISSLDQLIRILSEKGCHRILVKRLAENDNSKNQVYMGSGFGTLNFFPGLVIKPDKSGRLGAIFKAFMNFSWIDDAGNECPAPETKLILYPQYPEVRFSGFLQGCRGAPSTLMTARLAGRILFFGIRVNGQVFGYVTAPRSKIAREFNEQAGSYESLFYEIEDNKSAGESRRILLNRLKSIYLDGWIDSKRLDRHGNLRPCRAPNCGGYTLEAELGIRPSGFSEPDFMGWEIKQHNVRGFDRYETGVITLMTPEPTGGYYKDRGVDAFIRRFGYRDRKLKDRFNFGGIHKVEHLNTGTGLVLKLLGYEVSTGKIVDENGAVALLHNEEVAAAWYFKDLLSHWNRKHSRASYIPSMRRKIPRLQYHYGNLVRLCEGTDFLKLLRAFSCGNVYYDPGIKLEDAGSPRPRIKRRSQFRVKSANVPTLYDNVAVINLVP